MTLITYIAGAMLITIGSAVVGYNSRTLWAVWGGVAIYAGGWLIGYAV